MNTGYASFPDASRVRRHQPSGLLHAVVALGAWGLAAVVTLAVMADTKIGPVVFKLTTNHGLHAGDVLAALVMSTLAAIVTLAVIAHFALARRR